MEDDFVYLLDYFVNSSLIRSINDGSRISLDYSEKLENESIIDKHCIYYGYLSELPEKSSNSTAVLIADIPISSVRGFPNRAIILSDNITLDFVNRIIHEYFRDRSTYYHK